MSDTAIRIEPVSAPWIRNHVLFTLVAAALFAIARGGFLVVAANRLAAGRSILLWEGSAADAAAVLGPLAALAVACFLVETRLVLTGALLAAVLTLSATLLAAADLSAFLAQNAPPAARRSFGLAFWVLVATSSLAIVDIMQRLRTGILWAAAVAFAMVAAIAVMAWSGIFDSLSLVSEFSSQRDLFLAALLRHIALVAAALVFSLFFGAPLVVYLLRNSRARAPVFALLNLLQTIPSIALFGLLIGPLTFAAARVPFLLSLGIGGIGPAPAIIALVLYSLLPLVRNATAGLDGVDPAVIDAARGMGMSERELFFQIRLPLALPALVSALRVVTIQAIGLATVAALIGAGGLGTFVFQGIGQYALDLVLLGALPIVFLALLADLLFQIWLAALQRVP
jgi:osmoprotectant transport system permease protein